MFCIFKINIIPDRRYLPFQSVHGPDEVIRVRVRVRVRVRIRVRVRVRVRANHCQHT